ncbi:CRISPR-associated endonuclease Cas2 [Aliarcobacter butzleri]
MKNLVKKLEELIDKKKDSLRFYHLCENCVPKSFELCNREEIFEKREYFI